MSTRTVVHMLDDLDGESEATATAVYGWDGRQYEIDLTDAHYQEMAEMFQKYLPVSRMVGRTQLRERKQGRPSAPRELPTRDQASVSDIPAPTRHRQVTRRDSKQPASGSERPRRDTEQVRAIRKWAVTQGYTVSDRGRISAPIQQAYDAAHSELAMAAQ